MAPVSIRNKTPKEYIKTQKVANTPNSVSQLETSEPKEIMVNTKMRTDVSISPGGTGASVTPEKVIPRKKRNIKPPAMSLPRKDPIPNQDIKF